MPRFLNRQRELAALEEWWERPGSSMAIVWGRRRVGKTALLEHFARSRRHVFHSASGVATSTELRRLAESVAVLAGEGTDVGGLEFRDWRDALEALAENAGDAPRLVILDEYPWRRAPRPWRGDLDRRGEVGRDGRRRGGRSGSHHQGKGASERPRPSPFPGRWSFTDHQRVRG